MNIIEEEMDRILGCDECEILEFNFEPLFSAVEAMQAEHAKAVEAAYMEAFATGGMTGDSRKGYYWANSDAYKSLIHKDK